MKLVCPTGIWDGRAEDKIQLLIRLITRDKKKTKTR